jgi:hypothetical protein
MSGYSGGMNEGHVVFAADVKIECIRARQQVVDASEGGAIAEKGLS